MNRFIASGAILLALGTAVAGCGGNSGSRSGAGKYPVYGPGSTGNIAKGGIAQTNSGSGSGGGGSVGTFSAGPALNQGRYDHTATTLSDGRVLVTGGGISAGGGSVLKSSEIFDPVTNTWTDITNSPGGKMTAGNGFDTARQGHTAVLLQTGTVIVAGGTGAERLDPATGQPLPEQLKTCFSFNPATNAFQPIADLAQNRGYHLGAVLPSGRALVAAGINQGQTASIAGGESYDSASNTWTNVAMGAHHTYGVAFTTVNNPTTVIGFGFELGIVQQNGQPAFGFKAPPSIRTEKMDAAGANFIAGPVTTADRIFACANRISSSNALIAGGFDSANNLLDTTETFDPAANAFAAGPRMTNARQSAEMAEIGTSSDQLIVAGIDGQGQLMTSCEVYGAQNRSIVGTVALQNARFLHKVAAIANGRTMVIGGSTSAGQQLTETDSVEIHSR